MPGGGGARHRVRGGDPRLRAPAGVSFIAALLSLAVTDADGELAHRLELVLAVGVPAFAAGYLVGGVLGAKWITRALARRRLTFRAALAAMVASAIPPAAAVALGRAQSTRRRAAWRAASARRARHHDRAHGPADPHPGAVPLERAPVA